MSAQPATQLNCTQCGGELHPDEGQLFVTCPYCSATVYIDPTRVVFHWQLAPTLDPEQALGALRRWMSGSQTVKNLDTKANVTGQEFQYFPLWFFIIRQGGRDQNVLQPGAATAVTDITHLDLPAGDFRSYDSALDAQSTSPNVPLEAALAWVQGQFPGAEIRQAAIVHVPLYFFHYIYKGNTYSAIVEGATGATLANIYPAKAEAPYLVAGGVTAMVYLFLALMALGGAGSIFGLASASLALILGLVAAPFLFLLAVLVASRV